MTTPDPRPFELGPVGASGPAVLCLHGLTGTPFEVRPPAEALVDRGFACVGPLLPGHGTYPDDLIGVPHQAWLDAAFGAWDELARSHARVYVLGLSMGGLLALALAARRPVPGSVVIAAPLALRPWVRLAVALLRGARRSLPKTTSILDPEARDRHPGYRRMPLAALHQLVGLQEQLRRWLPEVRAPLQLIFSRRDPAVDPGDAERIREAVASAHTELLYLEDSGHVSPVDRESERVAATAVEFLCGLERAANS